MQHGLHFNFYQAFSGFAISSSFCAFFKAGIEVVMPKMVSHVVRVTCIANPV